MVVRGPKQTQPRGWTGYQALPHPVPGFGSSSRNAMDVPSRMLPSASPLLLAFGMIQTCGPVAPIRLPRSMGFGMSRSGSAGAGCTSSSTAAAVS